LQPRKERQQFPKRKKIYQKQNDRNRKDDEVARGAKILGSEKRCSFPRMAEEITTLPILGFDVV